MVLSALAVQHIIETCFLLEMTTTRDLLRCSVNIVIARGGPRIFKGGGGLGAWNFPSSECQMQVGGGVSARVYKIVVNHNA